MNLKRCLKKRFAIASCLLGLAGGAEADVIVSVGYYDLAPPAGGNTNALPNPWYGSANTTFLGSASEATSSDPDEAAILFTNTGSAAVTLNPGVTVTAGGSGLTLWDGLIGAGGFSLAPGASVILAGTDANGFDGSDIGLTDSTISFSLNGTAFSVTDSNSILHGSPIGSANETEPWTQLGDLLGSGPVSTPATAPEPGGLSLVGMVVAAFGLAVRHKQEHSGLEK